MAVDNYKTVPKLGVKEMVKEALKNDLILSIKEETSNFYQGVLIGLVKRIKVKECSYFIRHL